MRASVKDLGKLTSELRTEDPMVLGYDGFHRYMEILHVCYVELSARTAGNLGGNAE